MIHVHAVAERNTRNAVVHKCIVHVTMHSTMHSILHSKKHHAPHNGKE